MHAIWHDMKQLIEICLYFRITSCIADFLKCLWRGGLVGTDSSIAYSYCHADWHFILPYIKISEEDGFRVPRRELIHIRRMVSSGMLRRVALISTDVSEELSSSFIRVTRIGELGATLAVTSNRRTLRRNTKWERKLEWNSGVRNTLGELSLHSESLGLFICLFFGILNN
jgi:hypothetical protein